MTQDRSLRRVLQLGTSLALVLGLSACVSAPESFQTTQAPATPETHPERVASYCQKLHEQGDHYVAIGICKRAFELDQTNTEPLHRLGDIMAKAGAYDKAAEAYFIALDKNPNDVDAHYGIAKAYMAVGRHDLSAPHLEQAIALDGNDSRLHNAMGITLDQQGRHAEAQAHYQRGLALAPTSDVLRRNMDLSLALSGDQGSGAAPSASLAQATPTPAQPAVASGAAVPLTPAAPVQAQVAQPQVAQVPTPVVVERQPAPAPVAVIEPQPEPTPAPVPVAEPEATPEVVAEVLAPTPQSPGPNDIEAAAFQSSPDLDQAPLTATAQTDGQSWTGGRDAIARVAAASPAELKSGQSLGKATTSAAPVAPAPAASSEASASVADAMPRPTSKPSPAVVEPPSSDDDHEQELAEILQTNQTSQPAPAPQTAALPSEMPASGPVYMVQVGSYKSEAQALKGWQVVSEGTAALLSNFEPRVIRADAGAEKGIVYRLRTGPLSDRSAGTQLCEGLAEAGFGCFVVKMTAEELAASDGAADQLQSGFSDEG